VLGLFLTLPYGKFVSGGKRLALRTAHRSSPITFDGP
jgi:hypothetical protein